MMLTPLINLSSFRKKCGIYKQNAVMNIGFSVKCIAKYESLCMHTVSICDHGEEKSSPFRLLHMCGVLLLCFHVHNSSSIHTCAGLSFETVHCDSSQLLVGGCVLTTLQPCTVLCDLAAFKSLTSVYMVPKYPS